MAKRRGKEKTTYYLLDNRVLGQVSIELPARFMRKVPWLRPMSATMGEIVRAVDESALGSVLVLDEELGRPVFAVTTNQDAAAQCAKKKKKKREWERKFDACRASCEEQYPDCDHLIVIVSSKGECSCGCLDGILETEASEWYP